MGKRTVPTEAAIRDLLDAANAQLVFNKIREMQDRHWAEIDRLDALAAQLRSA